MNEIQRLQHLAGIVNEDEETTKTIVGHEDDERDMLAKELYKIGKYAVELHKLLKTLPSDADLPHWWQAKITKTSGYISDAKHYLESELHAPELDNEVRVSPEIENDDISPSGV